MILLLLLSSAFAVPSILGSWSLNGTLVDGVHGNNFTLLHGGPTVYEAGNTYSWLRMQTNTAYRTAHINENDLIDILIFVANIAMNTSLTSVPTEIFWFGTDLMIKLTNTTIIVQTGGCECTILHQKNFTLGESTTFGVALSGDIGVIMDMSNFSANCTIDPFMVTLNNSYVGIGRRSAGLNPSVFLMSNILVGKSYGNGTSLCVGPPSPPAEFPLAVLFGMLAPLGLVALAWCLYYCATRANSSGKYLEMRTRQKSIGVKIFVTRSENMDS
jgi:hypothetical protein